MGDAQGGEDEAPKDDMKSSAALADEEKLTTTEAKEDVKTDVGEVPNAGEKGNSANAQGANVDTVAIEPKQDGVPTEDDNQIVVRNDMAKDETSKCVVCSLLGC